MFKREGGGLAPSLCLKKQPRDGEPKSHRSKHTAYDADKHPYLQSQYMLTQGHVFHGTFQAGNALSEEVISSTTVAALSFTGWIAYGV